MDLTADLTGLTEGDLLDHAEAVARTQRECDVQTLRIAVQHAVTNNPDRLDPALTKLPGRERARRFGGVGTPDVAEFRCAEQARRQLANATRSTEEGMRGFHVRAPFHVIARLDAIVAHLARILADLGDTDPEDHRRVKAVLVLTDPRRAAELMTAYAAWRDRPADPAGTTTDPSPAPTDEPERTGERPDVDWDALMPTVLLMVHVYAGEEETGVARVEGHGPVTEAWLRQHLGPHARFTVRRVVDIAGQAPVDAYEIPDRHRRAVHLMTPADTFPWGSSTSRTQQIDHTVAFRHGADAPAGQSGVGNYGPMSPFHHRVKTHGAWQVRQPFAGVYVWRDPHGGLYLVDHTGTRRIGAPAAPSSPAELVVSRALLGLAA